MADSKISELTAIDAVVSGDLLAVVDDPAGTPATKKATVGQLQDFIEGAANLFTAAQTITPTSDAPALTVRRNSSGQTNKILQVQTEANAALASFDKDGKLSVPKVDLPGSTSGIVTIQPAAEAGTYTLTLPTSDGDSGQFLKTDGSGVLSWDAAGGGSPGGSDTQVQFNDGGSFAGDSGLTFNKTSKALTLGGATVTTSSPVLDLAQTWNASGTTFTGLKFNVTDTASAAASLLMDLQVGPQSQVLVRKNGELVATSISVWPNQTPGAGGGTPKVLWAGPNNTTILGRSGSAGMFLTGNGPGFASGTALLWGTDDSGGVGNLFLSRRAVASLRLGNADTSASAAITVTIASPGVVTWTSHGLSTGTPVIFTTTGALPTGITSGTTYYVIEVAANTFQLATSFANALAGTAVNTSGSQSGTHTGKRGAIAQQFGPQDTLSVSSSENIDGADFVIRGSRSIGNKPGGSIIFQVAPAGSTGTAQNALADALNIESTGRTRMLTGSTTGVYVNDGGAGIIGFYHSGTRRSFVWGQSNGQLDLSASNSQLMTFFAPGGFRFDSNGFVTLHTDAANTLALRNGLVAQESRVYASYTSATNFQRTSIKTARESSGALSGATYTTTIEIPAYAHLVGVTTRVTTAVTGATTYDVGDGTDVDLWGGTIGVTLGSQSRTADFTNVAAVGAAATSRTVTLTANGSDFTGGVVEICLHYIFTEAD
jgi:hypothetical protein